MLELLSLALVSFGVLPLVTHLFLTRRRVQPAARPADAAEERGDPAVALTRAQRVVVTAPLDADAYQERGTALLHLGRHEEARADFRRVRALDPPHSTSAYGLACVEAQRGRSETALAYLAHAIAGDARLAVTAAAEASLHPLHDDPRFRAILSGTRPLRRAA